VVRPPTRSLSRGQGGGGGGVKPSGRRSAEPPRSRAAADDVGQTPPAVVSLGQSTDHTPTRSGDAAVPQQASVRRTPSKLVAPRASSASKNQQARKPIPTSVPTVDDGKIPSAGSGNRSVTSSDGHVTAAKSSVAVVRLLSGDLESASPVGVASVAGGTQPAGAGKTGGGPESSNQSPKVLRYSSARRTSDRVDMAPRVDEDHELPASTSSPEVVVDSALSVSPMQPMTSRAYMTSSGNPIMTSRLLSASQRPFTPLTGTWHGRPSLTNGYVSDGDVRPVGGASTGLRHSGYLSEGGANSLCSRRTPNLSRLDTMEQYLENDDDDDEDDR